MLCKGEHINTYLVESAVRDTSGEALDALQRAVIAASARSTASGKHARCLCSVYVLGDGMVIWLFEAMNAIDIRDLYEAAELPLTRIVEVVELTPLRLSQDVTVEHRGGNP
jgi:hypothetical protein